MSAAQNFLEISAKKIKEENKKVIEERNSLKQKRK